MEQELSNYLENVSKFFAKRLVGIYYGREFADRRPEFQYGSGFVVESHGYHFLVTASHVLEGMGEWMEKDNFIGAVLALDSNNSGYSEYRLTDDDFVFARYWSKNELDIGIIPLSKEFVRLAQITGLVPINREFISIAPPGPRDLRLLIGYSANDAILQDQDLFYIRSNGKEYTRKLSKVASLTMRTIRLSTDVQSAGDSLTSRPIGENLPSVVGLSGGFVVDLPISTREYIWVGVQSSQLPYTRAGIKCVETVTYVKASAAMDAIDGFISENLQQLAREDAEAS